jgi:hypothetical protein
MSVCDADGEEVGTVAAVHAQAPVKVGGQADGLSSYVAVRTRADGLPDMLYVLVSALRAVTQRCLLLKHRRGDVPHEDWWERPASYFDPPA